MVGQITIAVTSCGARVSCRRPGSSAVVALVDMAIDETRTRELDGKGEEQTGRWDGHSVA